METQERANVLGRKVEKLWPHERSSLLWHLWQYYAALGGDAQLFLDRVESWLTRHEYTNLLECAGCGARFRDTDQTRSQQDEGICPACGHDDVRPVRLDTEKQNADLTSMREASSVRG